MCQSGFGRNYGVMTVKMGEMCCFTADTLAEMSRNYKGKVYGYLNTLRIIDKPKM